jgi:hypothetical protein
MSEFEKWKQILCNKCAFRNGPECEQICEFMEKCKDAWVTSFKCVQEKSLKLMDITYLQQWLVKELEELENGK